MMGKRWVMLFLLILLSGCGSGMISNDQDNTSTSTSSSTVFEEGEVIFSTTTENHYIDEADQKLKEEKYREVVTSYKQIDANKYKIMLKEKRDPFFVYFGRETCPYCVVNIEEIDKVVQDKALEMYYINTEVVSSELENVRENEGIDYVPTILYVEDGASAAVFTPDDVDFDNFVSSCIDNGRR